MGRTLPSITQAFIQEQAAFSRFRRALRRGDQLALDDLFASARQLKLPLRTWRRRRPPPVIRLDPALYCAPSHG